MHDAWAGAEAAKNLLADDRVKVYPDASHAINGEHPTEVAADVSAFLESIEH
jgi:pimeloyl-ACP methyl ester carboxylesterase